MSIYFISDLHLSETQPHLFNLFKYFIQQVLKKGDTLYILGDFFEYWLGDDDHSDFVERVRALLKTLPERDIAWYFLAGNRDFLLGKKFLTGANGVLLPETYSLSLDGQKIVLLHGDTLCTEDLPYQAFRKKVRQPWLQRLFLCLPLFLRRSIAGQIRSKARKEVMSELMMEVSEQAVHDVFWQNKATLMIHGHVHRPGVHLYPEGIRYVLADWDTQGNYLRYDKGVWDLCSFVVG